MALVKQTRTNVQNQTRFLFFAVSVFVCYFIYGILQEKITRGKYGTGEGEKFTYTLCLVLFQCMFNYFFVKALLMTQPKEEDQTKTSYYFTSALTYLLGMVSSNMALQWINYPTQVVGKAAKPIPVMILGVLIGRKSYPIQKFCFVFLIVMGVCMFMYKDQTNQDNDDHVFGIGELLLLLSLAMDGMTGAVQEWIRSDHSPSAFNMMLNTNLWSTIILCIGVLLSGEIFMFISFVMKYPELLIHLIMLATMGGFGQIFIFYTVAEFGPLPCSIITTTRKFFTMLTSVVIYRNPISARQWFGAILVFGGLFLDMFYGKTKSHITKS